MTHRILLSMKFSALVLALTVSTVACQCPTIATVDDFDLDKYIEKTWYIQKQQVTSYQPARTLSCVSATYDDEGRKRFGQPAISVYNYDIRSSESGNQFILCATRPDADSAPAKLAVAPCFLPNFLAGPYWVAAVSRRYDWAIVVGGQPSVEGLCGERNRCTTQEDAGFFNLNGNGEGLWFFTRSRNPSLLTMATMEIVAASLGLCTATMVDVDQDGCTYEGHFIKE